jgi:hypothetical protein
MSPKRPEAVIVVLFIAFWQLIHATRLLGFLWEETPAWAKTLVAETATNVTPSVLSLVLGFASGIGFMILGPSFLKWLLARLWPDHIPPADKKWPRSGADKASDKPARKTPRKPRRQRSPKVSSDNGDPDMS